MSNETVGVPATVDAVKNLERKRLVGSPVVVPPESPTPPAGRKLSKLSKYSLIAAGLFISCFVLLGISMIAGVDTKVIKLTLAGQVLDKDGKSVANAKVKIAGGEFSSDASGRFTVGGLEMQVYEIEISADGFVTLKDSVAIGRGLFMYTSQRNFVLSTSTSGSVIGKLVAADDVSYRFLDEVVKVGNDKTFKVSPDGTFVLKDVLTGAYDILVSSPNYKDLFFNKYEIKGGQQSLDPISLTPAGDITGTLKSYLRENLVLNAELVIEGVAKDVFSVNESGEFVFKDLEVGKSYKLRASAEGYNTRDYTIKVAKGKNALPNFAMVEQGVVAYLAKQNNRIQVFVSDYDGKNPKQLTNTDYDPYGLELVDNSSKVVFASSRLGRVDFYAVPVASGNPQQLTAGVPESERPELIDAYPNYDAEKFTTVYVDTVTKERVLAMRNIDGSVKVEIARTAGTFVDPRISDDGKFVSFIINNKTGSDFGIYRFNLATNEKVKLNSDNATSVYDISASGGRVLYSVFDQATNVTSLKYADANTGQAVVLAATTNGQFYQFVDGSESRIIYTSSRNGQSNLYRLNIETNEEEVLTRGGGIESIVQQGSLLLYYKANGLYVIDLAKPAENKLVTADVVRYSGYKF